MGHDEKRESERLRKADYRKRLAVPADILEVWGPDPLMLGLLEAWGPDGFRNSALHTLAVSEAGRDAKLGPLRKEFAKGLKA